MYDNWLFFPPFLSLLKKRGEKEKENALAKLVLSFFSDPFAFHRKDMYKEIKQRKKKR